MKTQEIKDARVAVVVFIGPHHQKGRMCQKHTHEGKLCFSRVEEGINRSLHLDAPLVICGDSNSGKDVRRFTVFAQTRGVKRVITVSTPKSNTCRDAEGAVHALKTNPQLALVNTVELVTDIWHMPRASMMLREELDETFPGENEHIRLHKRYVIGWVPSIINLVGELKGMYDHLRGKEHRPFGQPNGKPDEESRPVPD